METYSLLCFTLTLLLSLSLPTSQEKSVENLFHDGGEVINLEHDTFENHVHNSNRLSLVLFYLSWCGHCINYAPKYTQIANSLKDYRQHVIISAINCAKESNNVICKYHNVTGYPTLKVVPPNTADSVQSSSDIGRDNEEILSYISNFIKTKLNVEYIHITIEDETKTSSEHGSAPVIYDAVTVYKADLLYALQYSLTHEIPLHLETSNSLVIIQEYLYVLHKYFPSADLISPLTELYNTALHEKDLRNFSSLVKQSSLVKLIDGRDGLIRCHGSSNKYRGYPCTLWTLFHTLTVQAAQHGESHKVLTVMRGYITTVFGCTECGKNFNKMAKELDKLDAGDDSQAVLWLWGAHNRANKRLHGAESEDPSHLKIQFPSVRACPDCRNAKGMFDESKVYTFLTLLYTDIKNQPSEHHNLTSTPTPSDMAFSDLILCYSLHILSFIIIAVLFIIIRYRRGVRFDCCGRTSTPKPQPKKHFLLY